MFILENNFIKSKYSNLLLILIFILIIFLLNIDNISSYLNIRQNTKTKSKESVINYSDIGKYNGYDINIDKYQTINEGFVGGSTGQRVNNSPPPTELNTIMNDESRRKYKLIIKPEDKSVIVQFTGIDKNHDEYHKIIGYLIILAKYNNLLQKVGHFDTRITNERVDINKILNKNEYSDILNTDEKKNGITEFFSSDLNIKISQDLLKLIFGSTIFKYDMIDDNDTDIKTKKQQLFLELLEEFYNQKYYNKSFNLNNDTFDNNLLTLFDDLTNIYVFKFKTPTPEPTTTLPTANSAFTDIESFNNIDFTDYISNHDTFKEDIENEKNIDNRNLMIVKFNKDVASSLRNEINNLNKNDLLDGHINEFLMKFIKKYESLTIENVNLKSSICNVDNQCQYTFKNMEDKDENGNYYYYKLGIGLIYNDSNTGETISNIYTYKYGSGNNVNYFKLNNSLEEQTKILDKLSEIEKNSILSGGNTKITQPLTKDNINNDKDYMDAYMKMLEPHIGNYPDEFTLKEQDVRDLSLADYINKNLNMGTINVKMNINDLVVDESTDDS